MVKMAQNQIKIHLTHVYTKFEVNCVITFTDNGLKPCKDVYRDKHTDGSTDAGTFTISMSPPDFGNSDNESSIPPSNFVGRGYKNEF